MHGEGHRRRCPSCSQQVSHLPDVLGHRELQGPRQITSANVDRIFDDAGRRFLVIEEKQPSEAIKAGQLRLLKNLAALPTIEVWGVRGTPESLRVTRLGNDPAVLVEDGGTFEDYQRVVSDWFGSPVAAPSPWNEILDGLAGAAYSPPAWCPSDVWAAFDTALTAVLTQRSIRKAA